jgi:hypothetical protein
VCNKWREPVSDYEAARRAGGRRRYNAWRKFRADFRRMELARLLCVQGGLSFWRSGAALARRLGVSRATICRDRQVLLRSTYPCAHCGAAVIPPGLVQDYQGRGPDGNEPLAAAGMG